MKPRVESAVNRVVGILKRWEGVDTISLVDTGFEDIYDPYFFVSLDVYCSGDIPDPESRQRELIDVVAFETLKLTRKDRFLLDDIPFRLEYKDIDRFNRIIRGAHGAGGAFRDSGTYVFYRLKEGQVIYQKSEWLNEVRMDLDAFSEDFWHMLREAFQARMEHYLGDLAAAVMREDDLFCLISSAGFVRSACSVLFAINHRFEPSGRLLYKQTCNLPVLPESFRGRFESLVRSSQALPPSRRAEVAELLAKSIVAL
ncbi:MAG: hypothetical protein ACLFPO_11040 [Spirochaetaceae bacterium]